MLVDLKNDDMEYEEIEMVLIERLKKARVRLFLRIKNTYLLCSYEMEKKKDGLQE